MRKILMLLALAGLFAFLFSKPCFSHGGQYRGPGGSGPPPSSSSNDQGASLPTGTPIGPTSPGAAAPGGSTMSKRGGSAGGLQRKSSAGSFGFDRWEFWWEYNKDAYLNLKNKLFGNDRVTGSGSFLLGRLAKDQFRTARQATSEITKTEVLPAIFEALKIDHPDVQDSSVLALARMTRAEDADLVLDHILKRLSSKHRTAQEAACLSLGVLGSPKAVPICCDLMFNTDNGKKAVGKSEVPYLVRAFAALSLGLIGSEEAVPELIKAIERGNPMTQKDLLSCAISALGLMGHTKKREEIVKFLSRKLTDPQMDPFLKANIPVALGKLEDPGALAALVAAFNEEDQHEWVRASCAIAIGLLADLERDEEIVRLIMQYIQKGRDVQARHLCFIALAQIGARDPSYSLHEKQHEKLTRFFLAELDKPSRHGYKAWAALGAAIHAMAHPPLQGEVIEKVIREFLDTKNPSDKGAFAISLALLNAKRIAPLLFQELCSSRDKMLQGYLCVGIGLLRWTGASEKIREFAAEEPGFFLRLQAAVGLGLMGDTKALDVLLRALEEGGNLNIICSVARALGQIGDVSAIEPLKGILRDDGSGILSKAFAVVALGIIGEKTALPWNARISENCNYAASSTALFEVLDIL